MPLSFKKSGRKWWLQSKVTSVRHAIKVNALYLQYNSRHLGRVRFFECVNLKIPFKERTYKVYNRGHPPVF